MLKKVRAKQRESRFYNAIVGKWLPEKEPVMNMSDGQIQSIMQGTPICPFAKRTRALAFKRQDILANNACAIQKCSVV